MPRHALGCSLLIAFLATVPAGGQDSTESNSDQQPLDYSEQAERFIDLLEKAEYREAVETFFANNPWMLAQPDQLNSLKTQMTGLPDLVGELHGSDLVVEQSFGDSFVYLQYIANFERSPVSFHLSFYRPKDRWIAYSMEYQEDLLALAKELAKMKLTLPAFNEDDPADESSSTMKPAAAPGDV